MVNQFIKKYKLNKNQYDNYFDKFLKLKNIENKDKGKLIVVTSINPTPEGEGKTSLLIGLVDAFNHNKKNAIGTLRQPSMGPVFGMKGGAAGGGESALLNDDLINLNFTGDFHAITSANNLIASIIENEIYFNSKLNIDANNILWKRCIDANDRSLREISVKVAKDCLLKTSFNITAASDLMSLFCLVNNESTFKSKLDNTIVAYSKTKKPITIADLGITNAIIKILNNALKPNVAFSKYKSPFIIHGGPFANIAHGCNSIIATRTALSLSDYVISECGFGADLGFEKFMNIKMQESKLKPSLVIICATIKSILYHGKKETNLNKQMELGFKNLLVHINHVKKYGLEPLVILNINTKDSKKEIDLFDSLCKQNKINFAHSNIYNNGPKGTKEIINKIERMISEQESKKIKLLYNVKKDNLITKVESICKNAYNANKINFSDDVKEILKNKNIQDYFVCMSKTQYSLSSDPEEIDKYENITINVTDYSINHAAKILVLLCRSVFRMPGLPKHPRAKDF